MEYDVVNLGQVFTPRNIVDIMVNLMSNKGNILEPSCGDGQIFNYLLSKNKICVGVEYDSTKCPEKAINMDFFDYSLDNKFDTIIGNPPYVGYNSILDVTKEKLNSTLLNKRSNLYLFFIEKCVHHLKDNGELIFIVPKDFLKASSSFKLNQFLYDNGTITDFIDFGDEKIFDNYSPNCIIFRYEKNNFSRKTNKELFFNCINGQIFFTKKEYSIQFNQLFFVKVGAASGADSIFSHELGNTDFVCSFTNKTNKTKKMFYNTPHHALLPHKHLLINRKIKNFNETNWFTWGRNYYESSLPRIYVNTKTRNKNPFFLNDSNAYDGSILAVFPKFTCNQEQLIFIKNLLNSVDWNDLGFITDNRFIFSQSSLENTLLPEEFNTFLK